jgi:hypothetical protein
LPRIADLSHSRIRARSSVLHLTDESARADPETKVMHGLAPGSNQLGPVNEGTERVISQAPVRADSSYVPSRTWRTTAEGPMRSVTGGATAR